ncbi:hypothetical protein [Streptodolium elevatio]|uniref:HK97 gp10 family phage protein n=1 Tax=Streptodolium elevatio TaxID=3157996 RepID=A0ABV3DDH0_9ACTN
MSVQWEKRVNGMPLERFLAVMDGVQAELDFVQFEIKAKADEFLNEARSARGRGGSVAVDRAHIETESGWVDRYVILEDTTSRSQGDPNSALSIEFGRSSYDVTMRMLDGRTHKYTVGGFEGLRILSRAAGVPTKRGGGPKARRHVRIVQRRKGGARRGRTSRRD